MPERNVPDVSGRPVSFFNGLEGRAGFLEPVQPEKADCPPVLDIRDLGREGKITQELFVELESDPVSLAEIPPLGLGKELPFAAQGGAGRGTEGEEERGETKEN
jgi:hypothetical protein